MSAPSSRRSSTSSDATPSPPGLTGLGTTSKLSTQLPLAASDVAICSEEAAITVTTLREILAQILEQTNALWERQESTNRMLDELRQSIQISLPQTQYTEIDERLHRMESLTETLVKQTAICGTRHDVKKSVQELASHSATDVGSHGPAGPSEEQLLGSLRPQAHLSSDIQDQATSSGSGFDSSRITDAVASARWDTTGTHGSTFITDQIPGLLSISSQRQPEVRQGTGYDPKITALVPPSPPVNADSWQVSDILDTVSTEREEMERASEWEVCMAERELAHLEEERRLFDEDHEAAFAAPEELARTRVGLDDERQMGRTEGNRNLANLVQRNVDLCQKNNDLMGQYLAERQRGEEGRDRQIHEMIGMTYWLVKEAGEARQREERRKGNDGNLSHETFAEELQRQLEEQRKILTELSDSWRADSHRQHNETISVVRATASEQVPYNIQGYLDEFSKALSIDVRMLLGEVAKLREERRCIQHEIGYLLTIKSSHAPGGEFASEWVSPTSTDSSPEVTPLTTDPPLPEIPLPRSAWRPVRFRGAHRSSAPMSVPAPRAVHPWVTWHPNPLLAPTPPPGGLVPDNGSPGLFGPRSPRD